MNQVIDKVMQRQQRQGVLGYPVDLHQRIKYLEAENYRLQNQICDLQRNVHRLNSEIAWLRTTRMEPYCYPKPRLDPHPAIPQDPWWTQPQIWCATGSGKLSHS